MTTFAKLRYGSLMRLNVSAIEDFMRSTPPGMTRRELAKAAGISESYLSELLCEGSHKIGTAKTWHKIATALGVRVGSIVIPEESEAKAS